MEQVQKYGLQMKSDGCSGNEDELAECEHKGFGNIRNTRCLQHSRDVGVVCRGKHIPLLAVVFY